jgi:hypothetical protein
MREYFPAAYIGRGPSGPLASGHINAVILRVVIQIVGIGDAGQSGYHLTRVCIQHDEAGRGFGTDEQSVISLVERHREVVPVVGHGPFRDGANFYDR